MLGSLSAYEQEDPAVVAIMRGPADDLDDVQALMEAVRDQAWPTRADDSLGLLALHEEMLGLPAAPLGVPLDRRQAAVQARLQTRRSGWKRDWVAAMNALIGVGNWSYAENTPGGNQLSITIPYDPGSWSAAQVQALAEARTPMHIQIILGYTSGFLVGISRVGDAL